MHQRSTAMPDDSGSIPGDCILLKFELIEIMLI